MYWLSAEKKKDPERRWGLPDRIFFGRGACHILAGVYLQLEPLPGFFAERIVPAARFSGNHIYVTDGIVAFDFHGYSVRQRLVNQHVRGWRARYPGWDGTVERVEFDLLDTGQLNARKMLGPDQFLHDPVLRAECFLSRIDHEAAYCRASRLAAGGLSTTPSG